MTRAQDPPKPGAPKPDAPIGAWPDALEGVIGQCAHFDRVRVVAETGSTQDAALAHAGGRPGLVLVAGRQTAGRGRFGRAWADTADLGLAVTFVVGGEAADAALALAAGVAACGAAEVSLDEPGQVGLKWPNDVVEREGGARKVCGALVERRGGVALVGIGINVLQEAGDWPGGLAERCVSLRQLGSQASRLDVAVALLALFDAALGMAPAELAAAWNARHVHAGSRQVLLCAGERHEGELMGVGEDGLLDLRLRDGKVVRLRADVTTARL